MKKNTKTKELAILGLLTAILCIMSFIPFLGYITIGPLAITLNMIPVAVGAIVLGPKEGAILGGVFGITSFLQCIGVGGTSPMGVVLFGINPFLTFVQRFVPRFLMGFLTGYIYKLAKKYLGSASHFVAGFFAAFLNTVLFMLFLVVLFWHTEYLQDLINGKNVIVFIVTFVGVNAVFEMIASSVLTGIVAKVFERVKK